MGTLYGALARHTRAFSLSALALVVAGTVAVISLADGAFTGSTLNGASGLGTADFEAARPSAVGASRAAATTCQVTWTPAASVPAGATYQVSDGAGTVLASGLSGTSAAITAPAGTITPAVRLVLEQWTTSWVSAATTCPGWPDAPGSVSASPGDGTISVTWSTPASNGAVVTGYTATATPSGGGSPVTCTATPPSTGCTLTGLTDGLTYAVAVTATNADGTGPAGTATATPFPAVLASSSTVLWLDGADASTLLASSTCTGAAATTAVGCWADKSAQANNATQATAANQPSLVTVAGHLTASFNGTGQMLTLDPTRLPQGTSTSSTFVVGRLTDQTPAASGWRTVLTWGSAADGANRAYQKQGSSTAAVAVTWSKTSSSAGSWPVDAVGILDDSFSGSAYTSWFQGVTGNTVTGSFATGASLAYLGAQLDGGQLWLGQVPEVIVVGRAVTDAERRSIQEYLARKWGTALTPGRPGAVVGTPTSTTALAVSWAAPGWDGGHAITDYTVQYRTAGASTWTTWAHAASTSTSATLTGLDTFRAYEVRVAAVNSVGTGLWSSTGTSAVLWNPTALGSAVAWWVDASDAATLTTSGGVVSAWADKSGNARDASQGTSANQPTVVAAAMGGRPAVTFDGTNDSLAYNGSFLVGTQYTMAAAVSRRSGKAQDYYLAGSTPQTDQNVHVGWSSSTTLAYRQYNDDCPNVTVPAYTSEAAEVHVVRLSSNTGKASWRNGSAGCTSASTSTLVAYPNASLGNYNSGTSYFDGRVGEIVITTTALSTTDRQLLEGYLAWKWGTQASLPVGHPYQAAPPTAASGGPSAPLTVAATAGDTTAAVTWRAPAWDGGSTVTGYTVTATPSDATVSTRTCTSATTTCGLTGLTDGVTYSVTVTATNALGTGTPSGAVSVVPYPTTLFASSALKVWLDAQYASSLSTAADCTGSNAATGAGVACWKDRSGNGWNAVSGATSAVLTASAINGHPALRFSKTNPDYYDVTAAGIGAVGSNNRTMFAVVNARTTYGTVSTNNASSIAMWTGWNSGIIAHANGGTTTVDTLQLDSYNSVPTALYAGAAATGPTVVGGVFSSSSGVLTHALSLNGRTVASSSLAGTWWTTSDDLKLGSQSATVSQDYAYPLDGDLGEVLVFNRALTAAERRTVEDYLARRWGQTVTPQAPTGAAATAADSTTSVSWTAPGWNGGSAITAYTATATPTAGSGYASLPTRTCTAASSPCTVTGLTDGITYAVTVAATNAVGTGPASSSVSVIPYPAAVMTSTATRLWLDGADSTTVYASSTCSGAAATSTIGCWADKSAQHDNAVQATAGAQATLSTLSSKAAPLFNGTSTWFQLDVSKLPTGTTPSTIFVAAVQEDPAPTASAWRHVIGWGTGSPGQTRVVEKGSLSTTAYIETFDSWMQVPVGAKSWPTGSAAVVDGVVTSSTISASVNGATSYAVGGLTNNTGTAVGAELGRSPWGAGYWQGRIAEIVVTNTSATAAERRTVQEYLARKWGMSITPQAPTSLTTATSANGTSATASWSAPTWNGGSAVTGYTVTAVPTGGGSTVACSAVAPATSCTLTPLVVGKDYAVTITATNAVGVGPASTAVALAGGLPSSANLVVWLDAADMDGDASREGAAESGLVSGAVQTWVDRTGHGFDVTAPSAAERPGAATYTLGGLPVITFNGSTVLAGDPSKSYGITGDRTLTVLTRPRTLPTGTTGYWLIDRKPASTGYPLFSIAVVANDNIGLETRADDNTAYSSGGGSFAWSPGRADVLTAIRSGATNTLIESGHASAGTTTVGTITQDALSVGRHATRTRTADLDIGEVLLYNKALNATEQSALNAYLQAKWSITFP